MKLNGGTPISWRSIALVLANALLAVLVWIGVATYNAVGDLKTGMAVIEEKDRSQDFRLNRLEAWMWPSSRPSGGSSK